MAVYEDLLKRLESLLEKTNTLRRSL